MILKLTRDVDLILSVILHPDLVERTAPDQFERTPEMIKQFTQHLLRDDVKPLAIWTDEGELMAVYIFNRLYRGVYQIHPNVLPEFRTVSRELTARAIEWAKSNIVHKKLQAVIPVIYPEVFSHAIKQGFILKEIIPFQFRKRGRAHAVYKMVRYT